MPVCAPLACACAWRSATSAVATCRGLNAPCERERGTLSAPSPLVASRSPQRTAIRTPYPMATSQPSRLPHTWERDPPTRRWDTEGDSLMLGQAALQGGRGGSLLVSGAATANWPRPWAGGGRAAAPDAARCPRAHLDEAPAVWNRLIIVNCGSSRHPNQVRRCCCA